MPVAEGSVEGKPVSVLRDTGCSTIVVRRSLVTDDKLTGREERCILIDGTVRYTPVAEIFVETPFYSGVTTAVCMKNPIYDLVIGNVPGAQDVTISQPVNQTTQAVQTRSRTKNTRGLTPLITPLIDLGTEDIAKLQVEDETLRKAMESAQQGDKSIYQLHRGFFVSCQVKSSRTGGEETGAAKKTERQSNETGTCWDYEWASGCPSHAGKDFRQFLVAWYE